MNARLLRHAGLFAANVALFGGLVAGAAANAAPPAPRTVDGFGEVAPSPAPGTGLDFAKALGCEHELRPKPQIPSSVILSYGWNTRKLPLDQAWELVHRTGNPWRVVGFCYVGTR
ncbi:MAG TPA: hypothetical protein VNN79_15420 [Actinomycetota bacterium]|nr:hypothetical protein [Actinomycetota bacterium]